MPGILEAFLTILPTSDPTLYMLLQWLEEPAERITIQDVWSSERALTFPKARQFPNSRVAKL